MKTLVFVVQEGNRPEQAIDISSDRALVGSGAHCDILLPPEAASWEHVVITQEEDRVVARVVSPDRGALFDGESKREAELVEGMCVTIGNVTVALRRIAVEERTKEKLNPLRTLALALAVGIFAAGIVVVRSATAEPIEKQPVVPDPVPVRAMTCPEKQGALPLAHQKLALARSKLERARFYPHDSVDAVTLFDTAAVCFRLANDERNAAEAAALGRSTRRSVEEEFSASRVRLHRALVRKDGQTALAQVKLQREILFGNDAAESYATWLAVMQSKLEAIASKEEPQ